VHDFTSIESQRRSGIRDEAVWGVAWLHGCSMPRRPFPFAVVSNQPAVPGSACLHGDVRL